LVSPQNLIWRLVQVAKRRPERLARVDRIQEPLPHPYREPGLSPRAVHGGPGSRPLSIQARRAKRVTAHTAAACRVEVINSSSWLTKLTSCFHASTDHDAPLGRLLGRKPPVDAKGDRWNRLARDCASTRNAGTGRLSRLSRWSPLSGIAFTVLFLLSTGALGAGTPGPEVTDDAICTTRTPGTKLRRRSPTRF
jgi:hypothetical protein